MHVKSGILVLTVLVMNVHAYTVHNVLDEHLHVFFEIASLVFPPCSDTTTHFVLSALHLYLAPVSSILCLMSDAF